MDGEIIRPGVEWVMWRTDDALHVSCEFGFVEKVTVSVSTEHKEPDVLTLQAMIHVAYLEVSYWF